MSILPVVTIPSDYPKPSGKYSTWAISLSRMMNTHIEADNALKIVEIGAESFSYMEGHSSTLPLGMNQLKKIKESFSSMQIKGFKPLIITRIIAQGILAIYSYTSLYNLIAKKPIQPLLPYSSGLIPLASFILKGESFLEDVKAWQKARGTDKEKNSLIKLIGSIANLLLYGAQVIAFLAITEVHIVLQVILSTIISAETIYETISNAFSENASMKKEVETPPQISMMV